MYKFKIIYDSSLQGLEEKINQFLESEETKGMTMEGWTYENNPESINATHIFIISYYDEEVFK
jgi:hypothetical protein